MLIRLAIPIALGLPVLSWVWLTPSVAAPVPFLRAIPRGLNSPSSSLISCSACLPAGRIFSTAWSWDPGPLFLSLIDAGSQKSFLSLIILNQLIIFHTDCSVTRTQGEAATFLVWPCPALSQVAVLDGSLSSEIRSSIQILAVVLFQWRQPEKMCHKKAQQFLKTLR